jgi:hypothetical protein
VPWRAETHTTCHTPRPGLVRLPTLAVHKAQLRHSRRASPFLGGSVPCRAAKRLTMLRAIHPQGAL